MDTLVKVNITCRQAELRNHDAFHRAAEFGRYDADISIVCFETRQAKSFTCSSTQANCFGWRHFKDEWERQFGRVNP